MRGNINKKYLRRRKSWFRRNMGMIIVTTIIAILVVVGIIFGVDFFINKYKHNGPIAAVPEIETESQPAVREVKWITDEEPKSNEVTYTPPANTALPYAISVNRAMNCVTVYGIDASGAYTIPVKAFVCSVGAQGKETILGESFAASDKYTWGYIGDNKQGQYIFRIKDQYLFQSVPYNTTENNNLVTEEFNKLGSAATAGSVRLTVGDAKWIYDNCPSGTKVTIYDDATTPGPLGKPDMIKIPTESPNAKWDPTDPNENNPWKSSYAEIEGTKDITVKIGEYADIKYGITATDTCGNDITDEIITVGRYTFDQVGEYEIKYIVVDAIGSKAEVAVKLNVVE